MKKTKIKNFIFIFFVFNYLSIVYSQEDLKNIDTLTKKEENKESTMQLEDVVVVGYGTQKKSNITGSVSSLKSEQFKDQPVTNLATSLQGKMTGINVTMPSGTPGAGLLVSVRGSSNPLYVVDGVPMLSESNSQISTSFNSNGDVVGSGQNLSSISDINPNDIESIEVLKDASAAAIYGARSANGVVLITTKKGKSGKTSYNLNYYVGVQTLRYKIPLMNSQQLLDYLKDAYNNDKASWQKATDDASKNKWISNSLFLGKGLTFEQIDKLLGKNGNLQFMTNVVGDATSPYKSVSWQDAINAGANYDWQNAIYNKPLDAMIQNAEFSAKGGNENGRFYISGSYFNQNGLVIQNYFKRYSVKINTDFSLNKNLKIGSNITLASTENRRSFNDNTYSGILTNALPSSPLTPFYNQYDKIYNGLFDYTKGSGAFLTDNPLKTANDIYGLTNGYRAIANLFLEYKIIEGLKFKTSGAGDFALTEDIFNISNITTDAGAVGGSGKQGTTRNMTFLNENTLNFNKNFGLHGLTILLGQSIQKSLTNQTLSSTIGYLRGSTINYSSSNSAFTSYSIGTGELSWFVASFFGRINYDYNDKYLASFILRTDGSSRFAADKRWGLFPAISLGWNLNKENFLLDNKIFSTLKLRGSVGTSGDQDIALNRYQNFYNASGYNYSIAYYPGLLADPSITWQKNSSINIGLDFAFFKDKLSGSIDYFVSNRSDILIPVPTSGVTGTSTIIKNGGVIRDQGLEISLNYLAFKNKDWNVNFNLNFNYIKNEVIDLPIDNQLLSAYSDQRPTHILKKGYSVGSFWGIKTAGFDADGRALFYTNEGNKVYANEIKYDRDATVIGKARPDFYGGFGTDIKWKNIDLGITFTYSYGNQVYNIIGVGFAPGGYQKLSSPTQDASGNWIMSMTTSNYLVSAKNELPKASLLINNIYINSDKFVEDASFIRCKNINLGYTHNINQKSKINFIQSIRVYIQAQNLFVLTKYKGYDPEVSSNGGANPYTAGLDYAAYPQPTTYTLGFNVNFQ